MKVSATIKFLARLPLYKAEQPFLAMVTPDVGFDPEKHTNLEMEDHEVDITDIRERIDDFKLNECGFQVVPHESRNLNFESVQDVEAYKRECEVWLKDFFKAEHAVCWDFRIRKNQLFNGGTYNILDPLQYERPARGAHNDYTFTSGPIIIKRYLSDEDRERYLKPGYRFRLINTWRSILPVVEDHPLAMCDFRSLEPDDLLPSDRVRPDRTGEVFHLHHNSQQKWYWLDRMTAGEPWVFVVYDTMAGDQARLCPHVSFINPEAPEGAAPRQSVETRCIVITKSA